MPVGRPAAGAPGRRVVRAAALAACLVVVLPWWTRNVAVTGAFLPTGSQGHINLPAGFSQRALDNEGRWRSNDGDGAPELEAAGVDPFSTEFEVRLAQHRFALALDWMRAHPRDVVRLMGLHVWQELRPRRGRTDWTYIVPATLIALVYFHRHRATPAMLLALAAMTTSIALTWASIGKFVVPVLPIAMAMTAALAVSVTARLLRTIFTSRRRIQAE